jgi:hypothetical protein
VTGHRPGDPSAADLLVLHAVRLRGMADSAAVAERFRLDEAVVEELLLDHQAHGWVTWSEFAGIGGWSLTEAGRARNEHALAAELDRVVGARDVVRGTYATFLPLNDRLQRACTAWQLRPRAGDALAANDHTDPAWDAGVVDELGALAVALGPLARRLESALPRFAGYATRFSSALDRVRAGAASWVTGTGIDSCHTVWFELHEDLVATLGIPRGSEA